MIAIGLIGMGLFIFNRLIFHILDERRVTICGVSIQDGMWFFVAILIIVSIELIIAGLAVVAWEYLP
jgi:hypothetical protein